MVIETVAVPNIGRDSPLFCYIYAKTWKQFRTKSLFLNVFNLNRMFLKLIFSIYYQFLVFLCEKVIKTMTVHENGCKNLLFWCIETNAWIHFRKKFSLFSHLILIQMFWLLTLLYLNIFTIKPRRNHHSSKNWAW